MIHFRKKNEWKFALVLVGQKGEKMQMTSYLPWTSNTFDVASFLPHLATKRLISFLAQLSQRQWCLIIQSVRGEQKLQTTDF